MDFSKLRVPIGVEQEDLRVLKALLTKEQPALEFQFRAFHANAIDLLDKIAKLVEGTWDSDPSLLPEQLMVLSTFSYTAGQYLTDAKTFLQLYEQLHHTPKTAGVSEADRKLQKQTMTVRQQNIVNALTYATERLDKRITVLQSILKFATAKYTRGEFDGSGPGDPQFG